MRSQDDIFDFVFDANFDSLIEKRECLIEYSFSFSRLWSPEEEKIQKKCGSETNSPLHNTGCPNNQAKHHVSGDFLIDLSFGHTEKVQVNQTSLWNDSSREPVVPRKPPK